jgi:DNA polymerase-3 subunit alpha
MASRFVPLHTRSVFSLLEGVDRPETLLGRAADLGYDALALTDNNSLAGAVAFAEAAGRFGIRPILGARLHREPQRATVLIAEPSGYRSLCKIISRLHLTPAESFAVILARNAEGLHLLADDPFLLKPPLTDAYRGRLWCEIIRPGMTEQKERALLEVGARFGARPVASLAAHFADPAGHATHRLLCAVRQGQRLDQPGKSDIVPAHHLADENAVHERFRDLPDALVNTRRLADACRSDVLPRGMVATRSNVPGGQTPEEYLRLQCTRALGQRPRPPGAGACPHRPERPGGLLPGGRRDRAGGPPPGLADGPARLRRVEPGLLALGHYRREPARPRLAAGAVPPRRAGGPPRHRPRLRFAGARAGLQVRPPALRGGSRRPRGHDPDPRGKVGVPAGGDDLKGLVEADDAQPTEVPTGFTLEPQAWPKLLASARALVGRPFELATHPSGFVLSERPVEEHLPLQRGPGGVNLSQLDKDGVERVGLAKIDLLSNRALSTLAEARGHVQTLTAAPAANPVEAVAYDGDAAVLALLQRGDTLGISQLETPGQRRLLRQLRPLGLSDVVLSLALSRPGVAACGGRETYLRRRGGLEQVRYAHPSIKPVLAGTFGVIAYDDILAVVETLTGWPPAEADRFRKLLGKPDDREAAEAVEAFAVACAARDIERPIVEQVVGQLQRPVRISVPSESRMFQRVRWGGSCRKASRSASDGACCERWHGRRREEPKAPRSRFGWSCFGSTR